MYNSKVFVVFALIIVSISCLSKKFDLFEYEKSMIQELANTSKEIKRADLMETLISVINRTMEKYKWNSQLFPNEFAKQLLNDAFGDSNIISRSDLNTFVNQNKFSTIYKSYLKQITTTLAKQLQRKIMTILYGVFVYKNRYNLNNQFRITIITILCIIIAMDQEDLEENVQTYNLSFDTYYILDFKI